MLIQDLIKDKPAKERATLKGLEIAKIGAVARQNVKFSGADYDIEIVSFNAIDGGVEVFARAWNPDGTQIGFGKDGSVDIERFRLFNPPILITTGFDNSKDGRILVENLEQATLRSLSHIIKVKQQKFGSENIVSEKVGNTTSTFFSDATAISGSVGYDGPEDTWANVQGATSGVVDDSDTQCFATRIGTFTTTDKWEKLERGFFLYDTSDIGSDNVDSASLSLFVQSKTDALSITPDLNIFSSAPASNTALAAGDFDSLGSTAFSTAITYASITAAAYNDFALNASGLSAIDTGGISKFGSRNENYDADNVEPTWSSSSISYIRVYTARQGGTTEDPKLVVEHTAAATTGGNFLMFF